MRAAKGNGPRPASGPDARLTASRLMDQGRRVQQSAQAFGNSLEDLLSEAETYVRDNIERRPYATLGAAAGVGFVVGGGVSARLLLTLAMMSTRALAFTAVQAALLRGIGGDTKPDASSGERAAKENP